MKATLRLLALLLTLSVATLHAQTATQLWATRYNGPANDADYATAVAVDSAGDLAVTGQSRNASGNFDYYTAKYSSATGAMLWEKRFNGGGNGDDFARSVAVDSAGNVVVTGSSYNGSNLDYYTAKYAAATGVLIWEKLYNGPANAYDEASSVAVDSAGNVVVTGTSFGDIYTAKYAGATGELIWEKRSVVFDGRATSVAVDSAGNVAVTGSDYEGLTRNYYTAKYAAADGHLLWEKRYDNGFEDFAYSVAVDSAGNVAVTGQSRNASGNDDYYTAKYNGATGAVLWSKRYNGGGNGNDIAYSVAMDSAGNVAVTGQSRNASGNDDYYTAKYAAADGALLWQKRYDDPANGDDIATSVAMDSKGNVTVTGHSVGSLSGLDYYTARYSFADGSLIWEARYNGPANNDDRMDAVPPYAGKIALTSVGGAVVTGQSYNGSSYDYATVRFKPPLFLRTTRLLPPDATLDIAVPIDAYPSPAGSAMQVHKISLRLPTNSAPPPQPGTTESHVSGATVRMELSMDGGNTFQHISAQAVVSLRVTADAAGTSFDTEMLQLDIAGGELPAGVMLRESPTLASTGLTAINSQGDGLYRIDSFFDIFTELTVDGGQNWQPASGALRGLLNAPSAENSFQTPNLPPAGIPHVGDRPIEFSSGAIFRNLSLGNPSQSTPPPPQGGQQIQGANATLTGEVSFDGGTSFQPLNAPASLTERVSSILDSGNTRFFDTEMLQLDIAGGSLPAGVMLRESPSKASTGRTSVHQAADNTYRIASFFDIFTELSLDGGQTWQPARSGECVFALPAPVPPDTTTQPPTLIAPAEGATTSSPVTVTYSLPETALAGSVEVNFHSSVQGVEVSLRPDTAGESTGQHTYMIDTASPGASPGIVAATGGAIIDGSYTVLISYQDALGNPREEDYHFNVTVDTTPPQTTITSGPPAMTTSTDATFTFTTSPSEPGATFQGKLDNGAFGPATSPVSYSSLGVGMHTFAVFATDAAGNADPTPATYNWTVQAPPSEPVHTALYTKGDAVPGAGTDPYIPAGATWFSFGVPAVDEAGRVAVLARWKNPAGAAMGTYGSGVFVEGGLRLAVGAPVTDVKGATFKAFKDPVVSGDHLALIATIKGTGVDKSNDTVVLWVQPAGEVTVLAREGDAGVGVDGATFKSFRSVSIAGGTVALGPTGTLYTATLNHGSGSPAVTRSTDTAAWLFRNDVTTLVVRERGSATGLGAGETVKSFELLLNVSGSPSQGRGHTGPEAVSFSATTSTGRSVLLDYDAGTLEAFAFAGDVLGGTTLPLAKWKTFGPLSESSTALALRGVLQNNVGGVSGAAATGIFLGNLAGDAWEPVVQVGDAAPLLPGVTFKAVKNPVLSSDSEALAFAATLGDDGVDPADDQTLWGVADGGILKLLAREGGAAVGGGVWKTFTSLAIPGGSTGPLFLASLLQGVDGIDSTNDGGVWGVDRAGDLRLLFREGVTVLGGKTVKSFSVLKAVSGSPGARRAFNNNALVVWRATFNDGSTAIVTTTVP